MAGTVAQPIGITDPPIDELLQRTDSKYGLVLYAAQRARQINAYYSQLNEGLLENVGPLVETRNQEKPLSIAMREINDGLLTSTPVEEKPEDATVAEPVIDFGDPDVLGDTSSL
ncbi:DNA-directed RNA polymerase subunit omega [Isoptericola sp. NEAU-Y5]|uniref:DNA-directed RNA polymerase subunit omega n=1 Tax=Isoptericola luteus TaxID=2879484 RepID=A0ABS7ZJZ3_9MICO|nr:DNA-directed RNA polymerase subunit omega [Isoptericola sp. NEAU-Y5]MCA5894696.1 DNA-directed RNA polymerase subunit omega [Isoptericola sp. NEAU-Y5]